MPEQSHICHLVENLERGGLERMVVDLALEQSSAGHQVEVVCLFEEGPLAAELRSGGIPVTAFRKRGGFDAEVLRGLARHLRFAGVKVLHTHNAMANYFGALAVLASPSVNLVNTRHGMGSSPHSVRREALFRCSLLRTSAVALVCQAARRNFVAGRIVPSRKATVVPNGIRVSNFGPASADARGAALRRLGLPSDRLYVGTVGRLNPVKDHETLLRAIAKARIDREEISVVVVGGGALMEPLVGLSRSLGLADHVFFLGDRSDVPAILPALDIFVLSSITEGYSISLLEACASMLPIVATDVGGNREIVEPAKCGLMVPARDPVAMSRALHDLASDARKRQKLGQAGRLWISQHGTLEEMARRYGELYRRPGES